MPKIVKDISSATDMPRLATPAGTELVPALTQAGEPVAIPVSAFGSGSVDVSLARAWAESETAPGDPGTKSSKTWSEVSASFATDLRLYTESDEDMALVVIPESTRAITRMPDTFSAGQVAPLNQITFWRREPNPTMAPYFESAGSEVWVQTGLRENEVLSVLAGALSAYTPLGEEVLFPDASTALDLWWGNRVFPDLVTFNAATIPAAVTSVWVMCSGRVLRFQREAGAAYTDLKAGWVPGGDIFDLHFGAVNDYEDTGDVGTNNLSALNAATDYAATVGEYVWITGPSYVTGPVRPADGCRGFKATRPVGSSLDQTGAPAWPSGYPLGSAIIGGHTDGPVVHLRYPDQWVHGLEIGATAARNGATITTGTGNTNCGLVIEPPDTPDGHVQRSGAIGCLIRNQPAEGWMLCGKVSSIDMTGNTEINCGRHGFLIDNGQTTGRTNKYRPGIITVKNDRQINLGGHQFKIGHESSGADVPYRVEVIRPEGIRGGNTPAHLVVSAPYYVIGEQVTITNAAAAATSDVTGEVPALEHVYAIGGKGNRILGSRAVRARAEPYYILASPFAGTGSEYSSLRIVSCYDTTQIDDTDSPDILEDDYPVNAVKHNGVEVDLYLDDVSGRFTGYPIDLTGFVGTAIVDYENVVQHHNKTFKPDVLGVQGAVTIGAMRSRELSIDNGTAKSITFSGAYAVGTAVISGTTDTRGGGIVHFRVGTFPFVTKWGGSSNTTVSTGELDGGTGSPGDLTISAHTDGKLYVENQTGSDTQYSVSFFLDLESGLPT